METWYGSLSVLIIFGVVVYGVLVGVGTGLQALGIIHPHPNYCPAAAYNGNDNPTQQDCQDADGGQPGVDK